MLPISIQFWLDSHQVILRKIWKQLSQETKTRSLFCSPDAEDGLQFCVAGWKTSPAVSVRADLSLLDKKGLAFHVRAHSHTQCLWRWPVYVKQGSFGFMGLKGVCLPWANSSGVYLCFMNSNSSDILWLLTLLTYYYLLNSCFSEIMGTNCWCK